MKKVLAILAIAGTLTACGGSGEKKAEDVKEGAEQLMNDAKEGAEKVMDKVDSTVTNMADSAKSKIEEATK